MIKVERFRAFLFDAVSVVLFIAGIVNVVAGCIAAFEPNATGAAIFFGVALVLLFAATIDRFETLKGLGVEAKTRRLERTISEAEDALVQVRELANLTCQSLVTLYSKVGRTDVAPTISELYDILQTVRSRLLELKASPEAISQALRPGSRVILFEWALMLAEPMKVLINVRNNELQEKRRLHFRDPVKANDPDYQALHGELSSLSAHLHEIGKFYLWELEDYPDKLISWLERAPVDEEQKREIVSRVATYSDDVECLKRSGILPMPRRWVNEIADFKAERRKRFGLG